MQYGFRFSFLAVALLAMSSGMAGCQTSKVDGPPSVQRSDSEPGTASSEPSTRTVPESSRVDERQDSTHTWASVSDEVFHLTNLEREDRQQETLQEDKTLSQIACRHNQDMLVHGYLGHKDSDDRMPSDRVAREHRRLIGTVGENVLMRPRLNPHASGESQLQWAKHFMRQWMNSPDHRATLLARDWTHLGTCVSQNASMSRGTQVFSQVWAYLDTPLPWTMAPGDSTVVSFQLENASSSPRRYEWAPAGEPLGEAFNEGSGKPIEGKLYLPNAAGTYGLRVLVPNGGGRYTILSGPRVRVRPPTSSGD